MKIVPLTIETLYINQHSKNRTNINLKNNITILSNIITQVGINGKEVEVRRVVIPYNGFNIIMNLYKSKMDSKYYGKVLTTLTDDQLRLSRNMNFGKLEEYQLNLTIKENKHEEMFFELKDYVDYLNQY